MAALLVILLAAGGVALVVRVLAARRQRGRTGAVDGRPAVAGAVPTFRVVALGVAGAGKTVFLAGMFHRLHVQSPGGTYFLETSADQRVALSKVFRQVTDANSPWPPGTVAKEAREFTFDCMAFQEGSKYQVLRINYLDYSGELLEAEQEGGGTALHELEQRILGAHALLGMIDGHRVLQYLRNEPAGHAYVHSTIQPMIGFMAGAICPIHFVVTKWDLVRNFGEPQDADDDTRLRIVRDALTDGMQLEPLVARQGKVRRIVRLIPVSAVGTEFVRLDEQGKVVKRPGAALSPTNLEIPLSAVVPDLFRQAEASLDEAARRTIDAHVHSNLRLSPAESMAMAAKLLSAPAGVMLRATLQLGMGRTYGDEIATMFLDWMGRPFSRKAEAVQRARNDVEHHVRLVRELRDDVLKEFEVSVLRLETELSGSRLNG